MTMYDEATTPHEVSAFIRRSLSWLLRSNAPNDVFNDNSIGQYLGWSDT